MDIPVKLRLSNNPNEGVGVFDISEGVFKIFLETEDLSSFSKAVTDISIDRADFGLGLGNGQISMKFWCWPKARQV